MSTWDEGEPPASISMTPIVWCRVFLRGGACFCLLALCFPTLLILRLPEHFVFGARRPLTPWITQFYCISACYLMGIKRHVSGVPALEGGGFVANHSSWLDIFVLNASKRIYFVAKSEVSGWAGIGWLARATGTVFIRRKRRDSKTQLQVFEKRIFSGHRLMFFPEGTSSDGQRVLPFKSTLFSAFLSKDMQTDIAIQPVSVRYHAPANQDPRYYGWWGNMSFASGLVKVLATSPQGHVDVIYHQPLRAADFSDRKALAAACELAVREGFTQAGP